MVRHLLGAGSYGRVFLGESQAGCGYSVCWAGGIAGLSGASAAASQTKSVDSMMCWWLTLHHALSGVQRASTFLVWSGDRQRTFFLPSNVQAAKVYRRSTRRTDVSRDTSDSGVVGKRKQRVFVFCLFIGAPLERAESSPWRGLLWLKTEGQLSWK